jgi:hypothetical protein
VGEGFPAAQIIENQHSHGINFPSENSPPKGLTSDKWGMLFIMLFVDILR